MPDMSVDGYKFCKIFSYLVPDGNHSNGELLPHIVSSIWDGLTYFEFDLFVAKKKVTFKNLYKINI